MGCFVVLRVPGHYIDYKALLYIIFLTIKLKNSCLHNTVRIDFSINKIKKFMVIVMRAICCTIHTKVFYFLCNTIILIFKQ